MKIYHYEDHTFCFQYENEKRGPVIESIERKKGDVFEINANTNQIIFLQKGCLQDLSYTKLIKEEIGENELVLFPSGTKCLVNAKSDTFFLIFHLEIDLSFCDHFPVELLSIRWQDKSRERSKAGILKQNERIINFMNVLKNHLDDGLRCTHFLRLKVLELCFLIRVYYHKTEVCDFFEPVFSDDFVFLNGVLKNYEKSKTVKDLANTLHYSLSRFEKRFKKVFGKSPYQWMQEEKAQKVYHEINCTRKTFSEIGFEFGFSSASHFNDFCKQSFGHTPGEIRRQGINMIDEIYSSL